MEYEDDLEDRSFLQESKPWSKNKIRKVLLAVLSVVLTLVLILIAYVLIVVVRENRGNHDYDFKHYQCEIKEKSFNHNSTVFQGRLKCLSNQTHFNNDPASVYKKDLDFWVDARTKDYLRLLIGPSGEERFAWPETRGFSGEQNIKDRQWIQPNQYKWQVEFQ